MCLTQSVIWNPGATGVAIVKSYVVVGDAVELSVFHNGLLLLLSFMGIWKFWKKRKVVTKSF